MKVILILFLILFVIVSSLFLTTFISKMTGTPGDMELAAEAPLEDESISIISDIKPDTAPDLEGLEGPLQGETGFQASGADEDVHEEQDRRKMRLQKKSEMMDRDSPGRKYSFGR